MAEPSPADQLAALRAKLAASQRLGDGYGDRIKMIQKRIDELEAKS